jgi:hypothetical protein
MFRKILIAVWVFVFGSIALLALFPRLAARIPYPVAIRPLLLLLVLVSIVYGVVFLYRRGMERAKETRQTEETLTLL